MAAVKTLYMSIQQILYMHLMVAIKKLKHLMVHAALFQILNTVDSNNALDLNTNLDPSYNTRLFQLNACKILLSCHWFQSTVLKACFCWANLSLNRVLN